MAERAKLEQALRNASRAADAGDPQAAQDAKRLANALRGMKAPSQPTQQRGAFDRFARGFGGGMADLAGIVPGAAMQLGNLTGLTEFEDTSGSNLIKRKLEPLGLTGAPGEDLGVAGRAGEAVGQFGAPGAVGAAALARRGVPLITGAARAPAATAGARILDDMAVGAARAPVATGAAEMSAAAGESLGRDAAAGGYGDGWQADVGGLIGGVLGGLGPTGAAATAKRTGGALSALPVVGFTKRAIERVFKLEPGVSVKRRAADRLREVAEQAADPKDLNIPALQQLKGAGDVDSSLLTPAQQTDDPGIMSLAARQRLDDPGVMANWRVQVENNMEELRNQLKGVIDSDELKSWTAGASKEEVARIRRDYNQGVDDMVVVAVANAERRLANMTPNQRRSEASTVVRNELEKAYRTARTEENALWGLVPDDMVMPAETVRQRYATLRGQLSEENIEDMPEKARQFLDPDSPQSYYRVDADGELLTDTVPLKRLQNLRSALLNEARNASSGSNPNRNRARLAREMADGLLEDMANVDPRESPGTGAFLAAKGFSRHLNDRFTRGPVADVLQTKARGDTSIAPEATLDRTIGRGGVEAERATKAFVRALQSPSDEVRGAFTDFMEDEFQKMATRDGDFNPAGARSFMAKYRNLFEVQPKLKERFESAVQDGNLVGVASSVQDGAARVLGKNNPAAEIRRIRQMAEQDPTGAVWTSFRRGLTTEILERARVRNPQGDIDTEILSGNALMEMLDGEKMGPALRQAFNKTELANLRKIANTAKRIERDIGSRAAADLATNEPNALTTLLARFTGAKIGAAASQAAGGGAESLTISGQFSGFFREAARRGVRDPVATVIESALNDKQTMQDLLAPLSKADYSTRVVPRINAWLVGLMDSMDEEDEQADREPVTIDIRRPEDR